MRTTLLLTLILSLLSVTALFAQTPQKHSDGYQFETLLSVEATEIKNQQNTGTCWSFSCASYLESEMIREGKASLDLSEMYAVYLTYLDKAERYLRLKGQANFSQGSLGHDVVNVLNQYGMMPEEAYSGKKLGATIHDHDAMEKELNKLLKKLLKQQKKGELAADWREQVKAVLNAHMGEPPAEFMYKGAQYTSRRFADEVVALDPQDYVSFTSFSHRPMYKDFVLEVPDNYSHGTFYNVHIDELKEIAMNAIQQGYSIEWDCDVSDKGFSGKRGIAIVPLEDWNTMSDEAKEAKWRTPGPEKVVTEEMRQAAFDKFILTDDHLMHIVGLAKDQENTLYYLVKNSWGAKGEMGGYIYVSEAYFKMNTVSILIHKNAVPAHIADKIQW